MFWLYFSKWCLQIQALKSNIEVNRRIQAPLVNYNFLCIEDNIPNKLQGIFPSSGYWTENKNRVCLGNSFISTKIFQVNLKDMSEGHYVLVCNWSLMMTPLACVTTL